MNNTLTLSVVISAYNEEKKIKDCLESVKDLADEIVFVDNTSSDKTIEIAKQYTPNIFIQANNPMLNVNKNFGFTKAIGDWILCLDADERVTPELVNEIKLVISQVQIANSQQPINGYWIPRKNIIFGKFIQHTGWYPDHQLRLFRKGRGKFPERHVHEMIEVEGKTAYLVNPLMHFNYESIDQFLEKMIKIYTTNEADELLRKGYEFKWQDAIGFPLKEFLSRFFAREGYKDGFHGLILSILMAIYHFVVFVKIWEKQGFKEVHTPAFLSEAEKEFRNAYKEIIYWFFHTRIKNSKTISKKTWLRIKQKITQRK